MFPNLDLEAMREWRLINFKSENQDVVTILQGAAALIEPLAMAPDRAAQLSTLTIPAAVIPFIKASSRTGRFHKALQTALRRDFSRPEYGEAIRSLATAGLTSFAADARINFA